jgi:hypothetical protein
MVRKAKFINIFPHYSYLLFAHFITNKRRQRSLFWSICKGLTGGPLMAYFIYFMSSKSNGFSWREFIGNSLVLSAHPFCQHGVDLLLDGGRPTRPLYQTTASTKNNEDPVANSQRRLITTPVPETCTGLYYFFYSSVILAILTSSNYVIINLDCPRSESVLSLTDG